MLILEQAPSGFNVGTLGVPLEWTIYDPDRILQAGVYARWDFLVSANTATNGETFTIAGITFEVDNSVPHTANTFAAGGLLLNTARNFADMLTANYRFRNYTIEYTTVGANRLVSIIATEYGEEIDDPLGGDLSGLSGIDLTFTQGQDELIANRRLWYQFWTGDQQVGPQYAAYFDSTGRVTIDGQKQASSILSATPPDLTQTAAIIDPLASADLYLKYGTYDNGTDCVPTFGQVYATPSLLVANMVVQHDIMAGDTDFFGFFQVPSFMTGRAIKRCVYKDGYEWVAFLNSPVLLAGARRKIVKEYYGESGALLGTDEQILEADDTGVVRIPAGYQNAIPTGIGEVARYTIAVQTEAGFGYQPLTETMELIVVDRDCFAAQVFYLEDLGSWRTIYFDKLESRQLTVDGVGILQPHPVGSHLPPAQGVEAYRIEGGRGHDIVQSDVTFVLSTDLVTAKRRDNIEQMLRSPRHYMIAGSGRGPILRRVIFDRAAYTTYQRSSPGRILVPFRFNDPKRIR